MKLLTVIPLSKNVRKDSLSYFSSTDVPAGHIVSVPLRSKNVDAIVMESTAVAKEKSALKDASFKIKKITKVKGPSFISKEFLNTAVSVSKYFATSAGALIHLVVPTILFDSYGKLEKRSQKKIIDDGTKHEKLVLQAPLEERMAFYKTYIRESFARKKSVFLCLPTIEDINRFRDELAKGIESYTVVLSSENPNKKIISEYNRAIEDKHPLLTIGTPGFLVFPDHNWGTIILEHESANAYRSASSPYIDYRIFVENYAEKAKIKLIIGDTILRIETIWRHDNGELGEVAPLTFRLKRNSQIEIADMTRVKPDGTRKSFKLFSKKTEGLVTEALSQKKRIFLFALRRGLSSVTVCKDCGTSVNCDVCGSPLVLYEARGVKSRIFACNKCKKQKDPNTVCGVCGSWNLVPLGIGTDLVYEKAESLWPDANIYRIDRDSTTTRLQAKKVMEQFQKTGGILIGTEMALLYMTEQVDISIVVSFDSLFTIPSFRMNEKILQIGMNLGEKTREFVLIQTQNPDEKILRALANGNLLYAVRDEIEERSIYKYPPFATFIKVSYKGTRENIAKEKRVLERIFRDYNPVLYQAYSGDRGDHRIYTIRTTIKLERPNWALEGMTAHASLDERLLFILLSLPPTYKIQVDPEDLL